MATLTNTQISVTYVGLLKTSANTVLSSTAQQITDGSGNNSIIFLSTAGVGIGGAAASGKELDVTGNVLITGDLQVDNINIDGNTISSTAGTDLNITPLAGQQIVLDGTIVIDAGVVTGATSITSTAFVGALTGNADTATKIASITNSNIVQLTSSQTLTNKTIDVDNNTVSNIEVDNLKSGVLDTDLSSVSSSDDTLASAKAIKTYVDAQVDTADTLSEILAIGNTTGATKISVNNTSSGIDFIDNAKARFGTGNDLEIYHDGTDSFIKNNTGLLRIEQNVTDGDIQIKADDGGGSETTYIFCDGSTGKVELSNTGIKKLETTPQGIGITGEVELGDGTANKIQFIGGQGNWRVNISDSANQFVIHSESLAADYFTVIGGGGIKLNAYGSGSKTGTVAKNLAVDSSGNIIETDGGVVDGSGTANDVAMWSDSNTLTDAPIAISGNDATFAGDVTLANSNSLRWTSDDVRIEATTVSDNMKFYVGGSEILKLEQSGTLATFAGDITATSKKFISTSSSSGDYVRLYAGSGTAQWDIYGSGENLRLSENSSGGGIFQVDSGATFTGGITTTSATGIKIDTTGNAILELDGASGSTEAIIFRHSGTEVSRISHSNSTSLVFSTGSSVTTALTLDSSGNLIVGDTSSDLSSSGRGVVEINGTSQAILGLKVNGDVKTYLFQNGDNVELNNTASGSLTLKTAATTALTLDASQNATFAGDISLADSKKAIFGAGSDLEIYHDGSNSYINETGTGSLITQTSAYFLRQGGTNNTNNAIVANTSVDLYYDNAKKFETTSTGVTVTGATNRFVVDSSSASAIDIGFISSARTIRAIETGGGNARPLTILAQDFTFKDDSATRLTIDSTSATFAGTIEHSSSASGNVVGALLKNTNQSGSADSVSLNLGLGRTADSLIFSIPVIKLLKEQQWTGTGSTIDGALVFSTIENETIAEKMRLDSSGDLGIGISSPLGKIHTFSTSTNVDGDYGGNNFGVIVSQDNGNNAGDEGNGIVFTQQYAADGVDAGQVRTGAIIGHKVSATGSFGGGLKFKVQPAGANPLATALTISNNSLATFAGRVVVDNLYSNTFVEAATLVYTSNGSTGAPSYTFSTDPNTGIYHPSADTIAFSTGGSERMRIDSSGFLLIGKTSTGLATVGIEAAVDTLRATKTSSAPVEFNRGGSDGDIVLFYKDTVGKGSISITSSAVSYNTSSDYRLKEDLQDFAGLDMVSKIPVYDFKWIADESRSYGVMAHELEEVLPQAVNGKKDAEEMQSVDYSKIVPLLVKSIQELKKEIEILKNK
jgi:hypothetical protein